MVFSKEAARQAGMDARPALWQICLRVPSGLRVRVSVSDLQPTPSLSENRLRVCLCLFTNSVWSVRSGGTRARLPLQPACCRRPPGPVTSRSVACGRRTPCRRSEPHSGLTSTEHLFLQSSSVLSPQWSVQASPKQGVTWGQSLSSGHQPFPGPSQSTRLPVLFPGHQAEKSGCGR